MLSSPRLKFGAHQLFMHQGPLNSLAATGLHCNWKLVMCPG